MIKINVQRILDKIEEKMRFDLINNIQTDSDYLLISKKLKNLFFKEYSLKIDIEYNFVMGITGTYYEGVDTLFYIYKKEIKMNAKYKKNPKITKLIKRYFLINKRYENDIKDIVTIDNALHKMNHLIGVDIEFDSDYNKINRKIRNILLKKYNKRIQINYSYESNCFYAKDFFELSSNFKLKIADEYKDNNEVIILINKFKKTVKKFY